MTYVNRWGRAFMQRDDLKPEKRRSEARLKTYPSAEDIRAWGDTIEQRRQHILELMTKGYEKCSKRILPLEALLPFMGSAGNDFKQCFIQLWQYLGQVELNDADKKRLEEIKSKMNKICIDQMGSGDKSVGKYSVRTTGPAKTITRVTGIKPGFVLPSKTVIKGEKGKKTKLIITQVYPTDEKSSAQPVARLASRKLSKTDQGEIEKKTSEVDEIERVPKVSIDLQDPLTSNGALVQELRKTIENLQKEKDELKQKIDEYLKELEQLKNVSPANKSLATSCQEEINALENEIKSMRTDTNLSPEEEAELIKKEVEVLRGYCMRLKAVEEENEQLRKERDAIKDQQNLGDGDSKLTEALTKERDSLATKVKQLECELKQYRDLPAGADVYKDKSVMLDNALAERDELRKQLEKMKDLQQELADLRQKAEKSDQLERSSTKLSRTDITADLELKKTQSKCFCLEKELHNSRLEKDAMKRRIECMCKEYEKLRSKAREAEMLKVERDKLQIKVNDLSHVQVHNENLTLKCKCLENATVERDVYKQKYEEIIEMECQCDVLKSQAEQNKTLMKERDTLTKQVKDLEACIKEQDDEIKQLVAKIECLMNTTDESQSRMKEALANMRAEVENKESLIIKSEEELATVQSQLKSSIQGVSCETACLKIRIDELEKELCCARCTINELQKQKDGIMSESVAAMKRELETAREENKKLQEIAKKMVKLTADEHVQNMLKQSECAIKRVVEELNRQYREWDNMKNRQTKGKFSTKQCTCNSQKKEAREIADSDNVKDDFEEIQREKEKLVSFVKQMQNAKECDCDKLRRENLKLKESLRHK